MTRPADLTDDDRGHLDELHAACPHLETSPSTSARSPGCSPPAAAEWDGWMTAVETDDVSALHGFVRSLRKDLPAATAGLTMPYSNDPIEGVNNKVELLERQNVWPRLPRSTPATDLTQLITTF
ncbi:hypothetical protein WEH80_26730 [Actinomycetes bacterium KLBMP 9759]